MTRLLDELLLRDLGAQVAAARQALGCRRSRAPRGGVTPAVALRREQVVRRRREEREHVVVGERRRVRHVDDDVRADEHLGEPLAGDGVHARVRRRCDGLVAVLDEVLDDPRSDEAGAADDDDLHDFCFPVALWIDHSLSAPATAATASSTDAATSSGAETLSACETPGSSRVPRDPARSVEKRCSSAGMLRSASP